MDPALGKLIRILELERQQGYEDRAVIGGLEAFLHRVREDGALTGRDEARIAERLSGYGALEPAARAERVAEVMSHVRELELGGPRDAPPPQEAEPPVRPRAPAEPAPQGGEATQPPTAAPSDEGSMQRDDPGLDKPVVHLRGVGAASADKLERLGVTTIRDLLYLVPIRYNDFSKLKTIRDLTAGEHATVVGTVWNARSRKARSGLHVLDVSLGDTTATVTCTFFNQPFLEREFRKGRRVVVSGVVERFANRMTFKSPIWEPIEGERGHTGRLVPVYPLTKGLAQRRLRRQVWGAVDRWADHVTEILPEGLRRDERLMSIADAIRSLHGPKTEGDLAESRRRLAFDELLVFQLWLRQRRRRRLSRAGYDMSGGDDAVARLLSSLPFQPTGAQSRVIDEIAADMRSGAPMSRLLQGDVGSGKTVVAAASIVGCVESGRQAVLMAPTEILADQHLASLRRMLEPLGYRLFDPSVDNDAAQDTPVVARLVGSMRDGEKAVTKRAVSDGAIDLLVGTHAVIQTDVDVPRLGLVVIDEQHRFGVLQRAELPRRGGETGATGSDSLAVSGPDSDRGVDDYQPHVLIMTATPIPRTLAQVVNADLDQSMIDEMPPGRQPVKTSWLKPHERERAYQYIRHRLEAGEQAFVVCPRVEPDPSSEEDEVLRAAVAEHERLSTEIFPTTTVGLLHGRMPASEKEATMRAFRDGEIRVLVATSVIEVGVDVPNATVMLVEGADRFGLAQLHQFRGRVGRGSRESVCLLLADDPSERAADRLRTLAETNDGVLLAEKDLEMRGPGDYFGLRQSGFVNRFRFATLTSGAQIYDAQRVASAILDQDEDMAGDEWHALRTRVDGFGAGAERV